MILPLLFITAAQCLAAEGTMNYPDRKALVVNNCPHVSLSGFWFENRYERANYRFVQGITWANLSGQSIVAFEIVILKYDAFNDRINGCRWTITGTDSQNWTPILPGYAGSDFSFGSTTEEVFTAIAYVRAVRLKDGTIWKQDPKQLLEKLKETAKEITSLGDLNGEIKIKSNQ